MSFKTTLTLLVFGLCAATVSLAGFQLKTAWDKRVEARHNLGDVPRLMGIKTITDILVAERVYVYATLASYKALAADDMSAALTSFEATDQVIESALEHQKPAFAAQAMTELEVYRDARLAALEAAQTSAMLRDMSSGQVWLDAADRFEQVFRDAALNTSAGDPAVSRLVEEIAYFKSALSWDAVELVGLLASNGLFTADTVAKLTRHKTRYDRALEQISRLTQNDLQSLATPATQFQTKFAETYVATRAEILTARINGGDFPKTAGSDAWLAMTTDALASLEVFRTAVLTDILDREKHGLAKAEKNFLISASVIAATLLGSIGAFLVVIFMVVRPLEKSVGAVKKLAAGDVEFSLSGFSRRHELGALTNAIHALRDAERLARKTREERERINEELIASVDDVVSAAALGDFDRSIPRPCGEIDEGTDALVQGVTRLCDIVSGFATDLDKAVSALNEGDLTYRADRSYEGLFGDVTNGVSRSMARMGDTVSDVQVAARDINRAVEGIALRATEGSARAAQQADLIEESRATLDELSNSVTLSSKAAQDAAMAGLTVVDQTAASVEMIDQTAASMARVEQSSKDISDIVSMIEEIAFQTNILALNASVEAARAGNSGSGFAVVAQEVRALAHRVSEAAMDIGGLITTSVTQVRDAAGSVRATNAKLRSIKDEITSVVDAVQTIAAICQEQSAAAASVSARFEGLNETAKTNAHTADTNRATAAELTKSAHHMLSQVSFFRTETSKALDGSQDAAA